MNDPKLCLHRRHLLGEIYCWHWLIVIKDKRRSEKNNFVSIDFFFFWIQLFLA